MTSAAPRVSVGLPVFNGERYVADAIESVLAQTFEDFELIISDNASTDRTAAICREYAARDPRVRYHRNDRNIGAAPNFNRAFRLSCGQYFKWAAHDDLLAPEFLAKCVAVLDADPRTVLCHTLVTIADENGQSLGTFDSRMDGSAAPSAADRFAAVILSNRFCFDIFGLMRVSAIERIKLGSFPRSDEAFLGELALLGPILKVPEPLYTNRDHPGRYMRKVQFRPDHSLSWFDANRAGETVLPSWTLFAAYLRMIRVHVPGRRERARCYGHALRWLTVNWNLVRMGLDLVGAVAPGGVDTAHAVKRRLFGAATIPYLAADRRATGRDTE
jgi:glycosyltransferase involved in cell wall biosynthesis